MSSDDRCNWLDMLRHLSAGGKATAYYAASSAKLLYVHVGRKELCGTSKTALSCDPLFDIGEVSSDRVAPVTVTPCGLEFLRGVPIRELRKKYGFPWTAYTLLANRKRSMSEDYADNLKEYRRAYRKNKRDTMSKADIIKENRERRARELSIHTENG